MRSPLRLILDMLAPAALVFWILIEAYGAFLGPSSQRAIKILIAERDAVAAEVAAIEAHRDTLRARADMLNPRRLDPDLIDERIRAVLGYVEVNELVIPREEFENALNSSKRSLSDD